MAVSFTNGVICEKKKMYQDEETTGRVSQTTSKTDGLNDIKDTGATGTAGKRVTGAEATTRWFSQERFKAKGISS